MKINILIEFKIVLFDLKIFIVFYKYSFRFRYFKFVFYDRENKVVLILLIENFIIENWYNF